MTARPGLTPRRALYDARSLRALPTLGFLAAGLAIIALLWMTASEPGRTNTLTIGLCMMACGFSFAIAVVVQSNIRTLGVNRYRTPWAAADREQFMAALMAVRVLHHMVTVDDSDAVPSFVFSPTVDAVREATADVARFQLQLLDDDTAREWSAAVYGYLSSTPNPFTPEVPAA